MAPVPPTITATIVLPTTVDINNIKPSPTAVMNFGHASVANDTQFWFNQNITALDGTTIVNLENFVPFLTGATCGSSQIVLQFTSAQAIQMAVSNWPKTFTLMTSDAVYCGSGSGGRAFYTVSAVAFDSTKKTATLAAQSADIYSVCSRVTAAYGTTVTNTTTAQAKKEKRWGNDGSTSFYLNTNNAFTSFMQDFIEGFNLGFNAVTDLDPAPFLGVQGETTINNRIQCPGCGLTAQVQLFGGYDWNFGFNYVKGGFRLQDAVLNAGFNVIATKDYSVDKAIGLDHIALPGLNVAGCISVSPTAGLQAKVSMDLSAGVTVNNLGIEWHSNQDLYFEVDLLNHHASFSGWDQGLVPNILRPTLQDMTSDFQARMSIGPNLGIEVEVLSGLGKRP